MAIGQCAMENLVIPQDPALAFQGRRVLVTGHTGFKGSWLSLWLAQAGAEVTGYALPPASLPSHWHDLHLPIESHRGDIRHGDHLQAVFSAAQPEIVFHLAAQALVRRAYADPLASIDTNVMGTAQVLEACRKTPSVRAVVVVTTDKCYENREWAWGYREDDALGGRDPYSASKAATELVARCYRDAFLSASACLLATARAGNVIGGGDFSEDRLIPDAYRAFGSGVPLCIRSPQATRPWQHVLDCLQGYLRLGAGLLQGRTEWARAWNFGPTAADNQSVLSVLQLLKSHWPELHWQIEQPAQQLHEASFLYLDASLARRELGWQPVWQLNEAIRQTATWYREYASGNSTTSAAQLAAYLADLQAGTCSQA